MLEGSYRGPGTRSGSGVAEAGTVAVVKLSEGEAVLGAVLGWRLPKSKIRRGLMLHIIPPSSYDSII
jgi:uncharacterized membrane protein YbhN (UPF0104 family)